MRLNKATVLIVLILFMIVSTKTKAESTVGTKTKENKICNKHHFDRGQLEVIKKSFIYGNSFNLGYSLAAIAWQESLAGKYLINVNDPSFGVYHILISSAAKRSNTKGIEINKLALSLIKDQKLSASFAIKELLFWKSTLKKPDKTWRNIWAAYNGGYNFRSSQAQNYARNVGNKVEWLRTCLISHTPKIKIRLAEGK